MTLSIQFILGLNEEKIPKIALTKSRDGRTATAIFKFENPSVLSKTSLFKKEIPGLSLVKENNRISTNYLYLNFVNGKPYSIEALFIFKTNENYRSFLGFMKEYANQNALSFKKF